MGGAGSGSSRWTPEKRAAASAAMRAAWTPERRAAKAAEIRRTKPYRHNRHHARRSPTLTERRRLSAVMAAFWTPARREAAKQRTQAWYTPERRREWSVRSLALHQNRDGV